MFVNRMYKLEKLVQEHVDKEAINQSSQVLDICSKAKFRIASMNDLNYVIGAVAIPYEIMIKYIKEYENKINMMDEHDESRYIDQICKQYELPADIFVQRFKGVRKLSKSLIYKNKVLAKKQNKRI